MKASAIFNTRKAQQPPYLIPILEYNSTMKAIKT